MEQSRSQAPIAQQKFYSTKRLDQSPNQRNMQVDKQLAAFRSQNIHFELAADNSTLGLLSPKEDNSSGEHIVRQNIGITKSADGRQSFFNKTPNDKEQEIFIAPDNAPRRSGDYKSSQSPASTVFQKYAKSKEPMLRSSTESVEKRQSSKKKPRSSRESSANSNQAPSEDYADIDGVRNEYVGTYLVGKAVTNPDNGTDAKSSIDSKKQLIDLNLQNQKSVEPTSAGVAVGVDFGDQFDGTSVNSTTYNQTKSSILDAAIHQSMDLNTLNDPPYRQTVAYEAQQNASFTNMANIVQPMSHTWLETNMQSRFVAQLLPDERTVSATALERRQAMQNGKKRSIHILLTLENLITLHKKMIKWIIDEKNKDKKGRLTRQGKEVNRERLYQNPALFRNINLAPSKEKSYVEKKFQNISHDMNCAANDYYRFIVELRQRGQTSLEAVQNLPIFNVLKIQAQPKQEVMKISDLIKQVQLQRQQEQMHLEQMFVDNQMIYNDFLQNQAQPTQSKSQVFRAAATSHNQRQVRHRLTSENTYQDNNGSNNPLNQSAMTVSSLLLHSQNSSAEPGKNSQQNRQMQVFNSQNLQHQSSEQIVINKQSSLAQKPNLSKQALVQQATNSKSSQAAKEPASKNPNLPHQYSYVSRLEEERTESFYKKQDKTNSEAFDFLKFGGKQEPLSNELSSPQVESTVVHSKLKEQNHNIESDPTLRLENSDQKMNSSIENLIESIEIPAKTNNANLDSITFIKSPTKNRSHEKFQPTVIQLDQRSLVAFIAPTADIQYVQQAPDDYLTGNFTMQDRRSRVNTDGQSTISSQMLEEMEKRARDPMQKMDVNLKRTYHNMRRFIKSATPISAQLRHHTEVSQQYEMSHENLNQDIRIDPSIKFDDLKASQISAKFTDGRAEMRQRGQQPQNQSKPRWNVPTAQRPKKQAQPNQRDRGHSETQIGFYKSTRYDLQDTQNTLAIDQRNSINLQGAIERYYSGGPKQGENQYNGDVLLYRKNINDKLKSKRLSLDNFQVMLSPNQYGDRQPKSQQRHQESSLSEKDKQLALGSLPADQVNMESMFNTENSDQGSPKKPKSQLRGSKLRSSQTIGFKKLSQGKQPPMVVKNKNLLTKHLKDYKAQKMHFKEEEIPTEETIVSFRRTPPNNGKQHLSEFHVPGSSQENNYEKTAGSYEKFGSTEYVDMNVKSGESPEIKGTQIIMNLQSNKNTQQTLVVNAIAKAKTGERLKSSKLEQQELESSANRDIQQVIATSSSVDKIDHVSVSDTKKAAEISHRESEAKEQLQSTGGNKSKPQSAVPKPSAQGSKRIIQLKQTKGSSSQYTGIGYEGSLSKSHESQADAPDFGVQGTKSKLSLSKVTNTKKSEETKSKDEVVNTEQNQTNASKRFETLKQPTTDNRDTYTPAYGQNPLVDADIETERELQTKSRDEVSALEASIQPQSDRIQIPLDSNENCQSREMAAHASNATSAPDLTEQTEGNGSVQIISDSQARSGSMSSGKSQTWWRVKLGSDQN